MFNTRTFYRSHTQYISARCYLEGIFCASTARPLAARKRDDAVYAVIARGAALDFGGTFHFDDQNHLWLALRGVLSARCSEKLNVTQSLRTAAYNVRIADTALLTNDGEWPERGNRVT